MEFRKPGNRVASQLSKLKHLFCRASNKLDMKMNRFSCREQKFEILPWRKKFLVGQCMFELIYHLFIEFQSRWCCDGFFSLPFLDQSEAQILTLKRNGYEYHYYETDLIVINILRISNKQLPEVWTLYVILLNQIFLTKIRIACWLVVAVNYLIQRIKWFCSDASRQQIKSWILSFGKFLSRNPKVFYMEPKEEIFFLIARLEILFECIQCCFISKNNFNAFQGIIFNQPWQTMVELALFFNNK